MLKIFSNKTELALFFCDELVKSVLQKDEFYLCLSGGSTPEIIFQNLAKDHKSRIDWSKVRLFWGDERCVPPDDDESNYGMTNKNLLSFINIPEKNVHRIEGEGNPEEEAARYSEEIRNNVPLNNGFPKFDLVMLGLGEDGHTASIFPNQMQLLDSLSICDVAEHPVSGQKRITLSGRVINNANEIVFLVTGDNKKEKVFEILKESGDWKKYPAAHIKPRSGEASWFLDSSAAELL